MAYAADPQSLFEADLASKGYVPLPPFAVIDECEFYDSRTRQHVKMDPARLAKMADAQNQRIVGRNDATPIILGHTEDHKDEANQPPIVGLATRFHVGRLPDGKSAVFARPWAAPGQVETFRKHPRRSVELWLDPDAIDPIALLGATTPRRDLGLHLFSRQYGEASATSGASVVRFSRQTAGRQPVLFALKDLPTSEADPQGECEDCGGRVESRAEHVFGSEHIRGEEDYRVPGRCNACIAKRLFASMATGPAKKKPAEPADDDDEPNKLSRGRTMDPVKCELPPDGPAPAAGDTGPVEAGQDVKALSAKVDKLMSFMDKFAPILEQVLAEEEGAGGPEGAPPPGGGDLPPGAGGPPGAGAMPPGAGAPPPGGDLPPGGPEDGPPSPPDREDGPIKKNAAGAPGLGGFSSAGYGNTSMPTHFGADPDTRIRLQRAESEAVALRHQAVQMQKEVAQLRLERMQDETNLLLDALDREGVVIERDEDFATLVRLSKDARAKEADKMRRLRLKKAPALPGSGAPVLNPADIREPVALKLSREDGAVMPGDPALKTEIPNDYDALVGMVHQARAAGLPAATALAPKAANGVKVR